MKLKIAATIITILFASIVTNAQSKEALGVVELYGDQLTCGYEDSEGNKRPIRTVNGKSYYTNNVEAGCLDTKVTEIQKQ